jgi:hypothetical protein
VLVVPYETLQRLEHATSTFPTLAPVVHREQTLHLEVEEKKYEPL